MKRWAVQLHNVVRVARVVHACGAAAVLQTVLLVLVARVLPLPLPHLDGQEHTQSRLTQP